MNCRHCNAALNLQLVDLGSAPPSNGYLDRKTIHEPEIWLPLRVLVCEQCWLVQTEDFTRPEMLFTSDYAYYSSTSRTWLKHAAQYAGDMIDRLQLTNESFVVELASNDGYLLKNFVEAGIPCLGIEPAEKPAQAAKQLGIPVQSVFFGETIGRQLAAQGCQADLVAANNVYAHVPDINDFTSGIKALLKPGGTITLEFPHLLQLVKHCQFDTIYHEHFSYLSLRVVQHIFAAAGLRVFDVELLSTHGGSLRVFGCHQEDSRLEESTVEKVLRSESSAGLEDREVFASFQERAHRIKNDLIFFLLEQKRLGKKVAAYGAAAKGNTLLNFAGIRPDLLAYVCDAAPSKQGKYLPGSRIPIVSPETLQAQRPDYLLILPWNISAEIKQQNSELAKYGTTFITAIPRIKRI